MPVTSVEQNTKLRFRKGGLGNCSVDRMSQEMQLRMGVLIIMWVIYRSAPSFLVDTLMHRCAMRVVFGIPMMDVFGKGIPVLSVKYKIDLEAFRLY